jgi:hypothetical protein
MVFSFLELARIRGTIRPYDAPLALRFILYPLSIVGSRFPQHNPIAFLGTLAKLASILDAIGVCQCTESSFLAILKGSTKDSSIGPSVNACKSKLNHTNQ